MTEPAPRGRLAGFRQRVCAVLSAPHRLMLVAVFFTGLAHLAFLPPFEGFDEEAHWSSIALMADEGRIPVYGVDRLDVAIDAYAGPHPYANAPPFEAGRGLTYREFRAVSASGPHDAGPLRPFRQGREPNWQAQHPPLYYAMLAPLLKLGGAADWAAQFFKLRLASWLFAFFGLAIAVEAIRKHGVAPEGGAVIVAAWPFLAPQFFPEMARLGNDSLCLFMFGAAFAFFLELEARNRWRDAVGLGLTLGLGLWTKAFFLPITAGFGAYFFWRLWHVRKDMARVRRLAGPRAGALLCALLLGGGWYVFKAMTTGTVTGGDEFVRLGRESDLISGLIDHFSPGQMLRGVAAIIGSFLWAGSWSLARPDYVYMLAPAALFGFGVVRWARAWLRLPPEAQAPLFLIAPMFLGLVFHLLVRIAAGEGGAGTPGWYLHILAPAFGLVMAWGCRGAAATPVLAGGAVVFTVGVWILQLSMFSGCAAKLGQNKHYTFAGAECLLDWRQLSLLGFPWLGVVALTVAGGAAAMAIWRMSCAGRARPRQG